MTAALLAMIRTGWVEVDGLTVFEATLAEGRAEAALCVLAVFLIAAHGVQWWGDFLSYRAWNVVGAQPSPTRTVAGLGRNVENDKLNAVIKDVRRLMDVPPEGSPASMMGDDACHRLSQKLEELNQPIDRFRLYAFFYVWIWHGALPVLAAVIAIAWSLHG